MSYAAEDRDTAEQVVHSLRARGHRVFFDRSDLPVGGSYEDRIEAAIGRSHILIFLISRHSVAARRFTLTELGIAERRWPSARERVLPVRLPGEDSVSNDAIPPYLRAITILEPKGNLAAETGVAIEQLRRGVRKRRLIPFVVVAASVGILAVLNHFLRPAAPRLELTALTPEVLKRDHLDIPTTVLLRYKLANYGRVDAQVLGLEPVTVPAGRLTLDSAYDGTVGDTTIVAGEVVSNAFWARLSPSAGEDFTYRICAIPATGDRQCSLASHWDLK